MTFVSLFQSLSGIPEKAVFWLVLFLKALLNYCGRFSDKVRQVATRLPLSAHLRSKFIKYDLTGITKLVVCPECHSLYIYDRCVLRSGTVLSSKKMHSSAKLAMQSF